MPISWDRILQFTARRERQLTGNDFITTNFALFWRSGAGVDRQHVLPTQTPRRIGRHGVTQSVIGLISRGLSCAADSHVPVFGPFEPMLYSPRVMSQARAMGDLGATQFNLQRRAMRHPSQCSYLVCDGRLPVALVVW